MRTNAASVTAIMSRMRFCRIARVPAPEIETLVCEGVRRHLATTSGAELSAAHADRELIERHVACVIIKPQALEVCLIPMCEAVARTEDPTSDASAQTEDPGLHDQAPCRPPTTTITLPWTASSPQ
jgi:hypothetical protein